MGKWDFWDWSLAGLGFFAASMGFLIFLVYALPHKPLVIPEVQASVRVGSLEEMLPNSSRIERWGSELVLVIRTNEGEVTAVEGRSPSDGCLLQWDDHRGQVESPCSYQLYNAYGFVIAGLSDQSLRRYPVLVRDGVVNIGSGT